MSELSQSEWALVRALTLMSRRLQSSVDQRLQSDAGISHADFEIMRALSRSEGNRARSRDLADMLAWEKSRISHQVSRMVARGMVARTECATDLRGTWVELTEAGRAALEDAMPGYSAHMRRSLIENVDPAVRTALIGTALRVAETADPAICTVEIESIRHDTGLAK